jgi:glutaminyl-peptide cyclotransferase
MDKCDVAVEHSTDLPKELYGEGIALIEDKAFELTWRNKKIIEWAYDGYDKDFKLNSLIDMTKTDLREGWGLTYNKWDKLLYATDGSHFINVLEPNTFKKVARYPVQNSSG